MYPISTSQYDAQQTRQDEEWCLINPQHIEQFDGWSIIEGSAGQAHEASVPPESPVHSPREDTTPPLKAPPLQAPPLSKTETGEDEKNNRCDKTQQEIEKEKGNSYRNRRWKKNGKFDVDPSVYEYFSDPAVKKIRVKRNRSRAYNNYNTPTE